MELSNTAVTEINRYVLSKYPEEAAGVIVNGDFYPCANVAADPVRAFRIEPKIFVREKIQAVIHSHCIDPEKPFEYDPRWPSKTDMEQWMATNVPWGIVATNGRDDVSSLLWLDDNEIAPLEGRDFAHGVRDCYSIIRDYYRTVLDIKLNNYPRGMGWWDEGKDLYSENFEKEGFVEVPATAATTHDVALFRVRSPVINHAAVIVDHGQILHHLFHRLSGYDSLSRWHRNIVKYIRKVK